PDLHPFPTRRSSDLGEFARLRHYPLESQHAVRDRALAEVAAILEVVHVEPPRQAGRAPGHERAGALEVARGKQDDVGFLERVVLDRKSTRLNSSHVK